MAKHKGYHRRGFTLPIATLAGLGIGVAPSAQSLLAGDYVGAFDGLAYRYAGWNNSTKKFDPNGLMQGLVPLVGGVMISKLIGGTLGVNRKLASAGVPILRI